MPRLIDADALMDIAEQQGHVTVDDIINAETIEDVPVTKVEELTLAMADMNEKFAEEKLAFLKVIKELAEYNPQWIPVTERLPERDEKCLCRYTFGEKELMCFYQVLDYYATDPQPHFQHTLGDSKMRVTHWMPLPEPPKADE